MLTLLITGSLFSGILMFGNKCLYVEEHKSITLVAATVLVATFLVIFIPPAIEDSNPGICPEAPVSSPETVLFILIVANFLEVIYGIEADIFLPGLVNLHITAHLITRLRGQADCNTFTFCAAAFLTVVCGSIHVYRLTKPTCNTKIDYNVLSQAAQEKKQGGITYYNPEFAVSGSAKGEPIFY